MPDTAERITDGGGTEEVPVSDLVLVRPAASVPADGVVWEAQRGKSRTQVLADRAAGWLFYVAAASAAVTGVAWTVATTFDAGVVERVVTALVIACPTRSGPPSRS